MKRLPIGFLVLVLAGLGCTLSDTASPEKTSSSPVLYTPLSAGYQSPAGKQGTGEAHMRMPSDEMGRRYARLRDIGIGYRQYNWFWIGLEPSGVSSASPIACPSGAQMIPADATQMAQGGYHRYRCVDSAQLALFDNLIERDRAAGFQVGLVLWGSPEAYRYSGCEGFAWDGSTLKLGCVPRDDAMDDFEDYVNIIADRYRGKIQHYIVWNENASQDWFDYTPITPKNNTSQVYADARMDKYADMMRRAHAAILRHNSGVMLYASTDPLWASDLHHGHLGSARLLEGLWYRLGTSISWSVAVHPYGDPSATAPAGWYTFQNIQMVVDFQEDWLRRLGIADPRSYPQAYLIASEQGWPSDDDGGRARNICLAHDKATQVPNIAAVAHNHFHALSASDSYGLLPHWVTEDLGNMFSSQVGLAYASTGPQVWGQGTGQYCCRAHGLGCGSAGTMEVKGWLDGVQIRNRDAYATGWACVSGLARSIDVHLYRGGQAGSGQIVAGATANTSSEPAVSSECGTQGILHRFEVLLPRSLRETAAGETLFVHGISPIGSANHLLNGSGAHTIPPNTIKRTHHSWNRYNGVYDLLWRQSNGWLFDWGGSINTGGWDSNWKVVGTGDFNGDGRSEPVLRHITGWVYAEGAFSNQVGLEWRVSAIGDLNGDGRSDILWRRDSDGYLIDWGAGVLNHAVGLEWDLVAIADLNGDRRDDLLWRRADGWFLDWAGVHSVQVGLEWEIVGAGDLDGNGNDDIVWRRHSDGYLIDWGAGVLSLPVALEWDLVPNRIDE